MLPVGSDASLHFGPRSTIRRVALHPALLHCRGVTTSRRVGLPRPKPAARAGGPAVHGIDDPGAFAALSRYFRRSCTM